MITAEKMAAAGLCDLPTALKWADALNAAANKYEINTPLRHAAWLAQCAHESGHFRFVFENLNYSAESLTRVFKKYFPTVESTEGYARKPERIAAKVYGGRMGNGAESTKQGWLYRGRGAIQLTGKDNYRAFGKEIGREAEVLSNPDLVAEPELAALSAAWFWHRNGLNALADKGDNLSITKRINGGTNGLEDRAKLFAQAKPIFLA
jgi:putative chitinase